LGPSKKEIIRAETIAEQRKHTVQVHRTAFVKVLLRSFVALTIIAQKIIDL
jgi:hypothetical protein